MMKVSQDLIQQEKNESEEMVYRSSKADEEEEERESPSSKTPHNVFRNDGSFLEMFKKMQEKQQKDKEEVEAEKSAASSSNTSAATALGPLKHPFVGKRRGGRVLPTGKVKKAKVEADSDEPAPKDAWSVYLAEVKRYKETTCEEDGKTRPLVK
ncbi:telomerase RNA component interacting RNase-like isoform X1 [Cimex lectularius]|uniref:Telomerase RNA component interacting RNase n=2 Tax=Cimex lectularius TaxID=79782 RepID=A0A8I6S632_CIMLE|nr:telomerase RNA component interacting RNase-like isoform X1 [Cimex lectularius]